MRYEFGIALLAMTVAAGPAPAAVRIDAECPAGNIVVDRVVGDDAFVRPDLRDTEGSWFYWCFRVRGAEGRTLNVHFAKSGLVGARGPAVSLDDGWSWRWLGRGVCTTDGFSFALSPFSTSVQFSVGMPYTERNLRTFLDSRGTNAALRTGVLARTPKGSDIELLRAGCLDRPPQFRVLVTARHHACEMMASYAVEGLLAAVLADHETGAWFRANVEFFVVPFVDKDGVEDGDQGKNRRPRDHNRDYSGESLYAATKALREMVPGWSDGRLRVMLDLHCPYLRGATDEYVYMPGREDAAVFAEQNRLGACIERNQTGPIRYRVADNLPFGKAWNTGSNVRQGATSTAWGSGLPGIMVATGIELPYANARGVEVNADSARAFGRDLARGLREYLKISTFNIEHPTSNIERP